MNSIEPAGLPAVVMARCWTYTPRKQGGEIDWRFVPQRWGGIRVRPIRQNAEEQGKTEKMMAGE